MSDTANVFNTHAHAWWDEEGPFKPLHTLNPLRLAFIIDHVKRYLGVETIKGLRILDVGCGGGLLTEPLARLGAKMTGIDLSPEVIAVAKDHAETQGLVIDYAASNLDAVEEGAFDVVIASEVIEHVDDPKVFVAHIAQALKPKGCTIITTLNRTWKSYALGIIAAENILKWAPKGAHEHSMFIKPSELNTFLEDADLTLTKLQGIIFNPLTWQWEASKSMGVNYFAFAGKDMAL